MSSSPNDSESPPSPLSKVNWLTELCNRFEAAWRGGQQPHLEHFLNDSSILDPQQARDRLIRLEMKWRNRRSEPLSFNEWLARFPNEEDMIHNALRTQGHDDERKTQFDGSSIADDDDPRPTKLLRYRITGTLGRGGFGVVYAAFDDELCRPVAIKVLHRKWLTESNYMERYLVEARALAKLDHPNIVPIFDVGRTDDGRLLMVAKYIEAGSLGNRIRSERLSFAQSARIVSLIADALHHAHLRGLIHRDVKAGNILLDNDDNAFIADFGLVLREEEFGTGPTFAGTPDYMSPEQARGEGHRVDGRSDIFSLGVVFYELLTGRRPFRAQSRDELLEQIANVEARPPRQVDDHVPKELERICLKALAKSATHRYTTALDMAYELKEFLSRPSTATPERVAAPVTPALDSATRVSIKVVPKGLRSFDAADADFFLELLPGPRDRDGIPDSVRFWQWRVIETDADKTFSVGLIYGPSGCGKSSLVKAGLLPRLPSHVRTVYIEAVDQATEEHLLLRLKKLCPTIPTSTGLADFVTQLRRGRGLPPNEKLVIVLDQFEQWLQSRRTGPDQELIRALRQCDGGRVQCLILVRDDFWMAISRLMREIEIPIAEGENAVAVDLFDLRHARSVLSMLGRAHGLLPDRMIDQSNDQSKFLDQAVHGLAQEEKVIPVRLALFSEMVKSRSWVPATLKAIGGIEGVGVAFLEESFAAATAPPARRMHAAAAREVLKSMLPPMGKEIKGTMRSYADLLAVSGYADRPGEFDELLRILHRELRLISPSDAGGTALDSTERRTTPVGHQYYQLTHDYLVPALRDWLTRKQRETPRGRAELRLAECSARYQSKPVKRSLPSFLEWINIRIFTRSRDWTAAQKTMMSRAAVRHGLRTLTAVLVGMVVWQAGWHYHGQQKAHALHDRLLSASIEEVPRTVEAMRHYRPQIDSLLAASLRDATAREDQALRLKFSMAMLPVDSSQKDYLLSQLFQAPPSEVRVLVGVLQPYLHDLATQIRQTIDNPETTNDCRLRAACALAAIAPNDARWTSLSEKLVNQLLIEKPDDALLNWQPALSPVAKTILPQIGAVMCEDSTDETQRRVLLRLFQAFAANHSQPFEELESRFVVENADRLPLVDLRRLANCGAALTALGRPEKVLPQLVHSADPTLRSFLIERLPAFAAPIGALFNHLRNEPSDSIRRALILALGNYRSEQIPPSERGLIVNHLVNLFDQDPDGGIHSATEWTLRQWHCYERMAPIIQRLSTSRVEGRRRWFINSEGQTFVIIRGPSEFEFGPKHARRRVLIPHSFAVATKEVTVAEFLRALPDHKHSISVAGTSNCPMIQVSWYNAAKYCNWLTNKEGGQPVFQPNSEQKLNDNMTIDSEYVARQAYRLPTEHEWEFVTWAGAMTEWACGRPDPELIRKYGWTWPFTIEGTGVRVHDVGELKPNELGLFDVHGNVTEWCLDKALPETFVGPPSLAEIDDLVVESTIGRVGRGESSYDNPPTHNYYRRFSMVPSFDVQQFGLRLVRSVPPPK